MTVHNIFVGILYALGILSCLYLAARMIGAGLTSGILAALKSRTLNFDLKVNKGNRHADKE